MTKLEILYLNIPEIEWIISKVVPGTVKPKHVRSGQYCFEVSFLKLPYPYDTDKSIDFGCNIFIGVAEGLDLLFSLWRRAHDFLLSFSVFDVFAIGKTVRPRSKSCPPRLNDSTKIPSWMVKMRLSPYMAANTTRRIIRSVQTRDFACDISACV